MIKRIVCISPISFHGGDVAKFGFDLFPEKGYELEIWDLFPFFHPELQSASGGSAGPGIPGVLTFGRWDRIAEALERLPAAETFVLVFVGLYPWSKKALRLYQRLSRCRLAYGVLCNNSIPVAPPALSAFGQPGSGGLRLPSISHMSLPSLGKKVLDRCYRCLPVSLLGVAPPAVVIRGGRIGYHTSYPITGATTRLWAHAMDYDVYLHRKQSAEVYSTEAYGVFLDEFFPFHPDFQIIGRGMPVTPEAYFSAVNRFLGEVESGLGMPIHIAAHPRSTYETMPDFFRGRTLCKGRTAAMIKDCRLVINSYSTAANFAVLFGKPVLCVTTDELEQTEYGGKIAGMAGWLGKNVTNMDRGGPADLAAELTVNEEAYRIYRESFITCAAEPDKFLWEIFLDFLRGIS